MHLALEVPQPKSLSESFDRRKHAAGIVRFTTVRKELLGPAHRAGVEIENMFRPDAAFDHLASVCGGEV